LEEISTFYVYVRCPTCHRTQHFFNNVTTGRRTTAPCHNN